MDSVLTVLCDSNNASNPRQLHHRTLLLFSSFNTSVIPYVDGLETIQFFIRRRFGIDV